MNLADNSWMEVIRYDMGIEEAWREDARLLMQFVDDQLKTLLPEDIVEWVEENIYPPGSDKPVKLDGYQVEPLKAQVMKPKTARKSTQGPVLRRCWIMSGVGSPATADCPTG